MRVTLSWFGAQRGRDDAATFERDAAIRLAKGLARWLLRQSDDMKRMIKAALIDGAVVNLSDLLRRVRQYFEREAEKGMPEEVLRQIRLICRNGFERVFEDTEAEEQTRIDEAWIDGFDERYAGKMSARLNGANDASVRRALGSGSKERVETALAALDTWAHMRSQTMARNEVPLALNEALIAGFRACGYTSVWKSAPSCCSLCKSYNDRTVTRLKPPLHLYCWCGVGKGEKFEKKPLTDPRDIDIIFPDSRFGKKAGKHMREWGLDPSKEEDRESFQSLTRAIVREADEVREVPWEENPETKKRDKPVWAFLKNNNAVLVKIENHEYITTMRDGADNKRIQEGKVIINDRRK